MRQEAHATVRGLALANLRTASLGALVYANAPALALLPGGMLGARSPSARHRYTPVFICCWRHREECYRPQRVADCALADQVNPLREANSPACVVGYDFGMNARVGPAWFVREWLPGLRMVGAIR